MRLDGTARYRATIVSGHEYLRGRRTSREQNDNQAASICRFDEHSRSVASLSRRIRSTHRSCRWETPTASGAEARQPLSKQLRPLRQASALGLSELSAFERVKDHELAFQVQQPEARIAGPVQRACVDERHAAHSPDHALVRVPADYDGIPLFADDALERLVQLDRMAVVTGT